MCLAVGNEEISKKNEKKERQTKRMVLRNMSNFIWVPVLLICEKRKWKKMCVLMWQCHPYNKKYIKNFQWFSIGFSSLCCTILIFNRILYKFRLWLKISFRFSITSSSSSYFSLPFLIPSPPHNFSLLFFFVAFNLNVFIYTSIAQLLTSTVTMLCTCRIGRLRP